MAATGSSNLYHTYRYKQHEPTFYFVKSKRAIPTNKYHFFVLQVTQNSKYIVTSSRNDGDTIMTWDEIVNLQPKLENLKNVFVHVPLTEKEKENYNRFKHEIEDEEFIGLPYEDKRMYLDIVGHKEVSDRKFNALPDDLKSHYISFGLGLSQNQFKMIENNKPLLSRYKQITNRKVEAYEKTDDAHKDAYQFKPSEYLVADNKQEIISGVTISSYNSYVFAKAANFDSTIIPQEIIDEVAKDTNWSRYWCKDVKFDLTKIPQEIIDNISTSPLYSLWFARGVKFDLTKIPQVIINGIAQEPEQSYEFAKAFQLDLTKIPQEIINGIAQSPNYSCFISELLGYDLTKIPQKLISSISQDPGESYVFAQGVKFDLARIPQEIINGISQSTRHSMNFAESVWFDPTKIP